MNAANDENLKNIIKQNIARLRELKKILDITVKINESAKMINKTKDTVENSDEDDESGVIDRISFLADSRGELVEGLKNIDTAVRHYRHSLKLEPQYFSIFVKIEENAKLKSELPKNISFPEWAVNLYKLILEQQTVLTNIKEIDEENNSMIKSIVVALSDKTQSLKSNRILMNKFSQGNDIPPGTFMNKKK